MYLFLSVAGKWWWQLREIWWRYDDRACFTQVCWENEKKNEWRGIFFFLVSPKKFVNNQRSMCISTHFSLEMITALYTMWPMDCNSAKAHSKGKKGKIESSKSWKTNSLSQGVSLILNLSNLYIIFTRKTYKKNFTSSCYYHYHFSSILFRVACI